MPDAEALRRLSKHLVDTRAPMTPRVAFPGCPRASDLDVLSAPAGSLSEADVAALCELREDLAAICERARARGIRITVDAEHRYVAVRCVGVCVAHSFWGRSWYQVCSSVRRSRWG